jgi:Holliday junction resolvase RusA-like endonuclease
VDGTTLTNIGIGLDILGVREMKQISVTIMVEPTAKGRPRATIVNGHIRAYTPAKTRNAESIIQVLIREEMLKFERFPDGTPLKMTVVFYRARPKSLPKRVQLPISRPDCSNYLKTIEDAANGYLFRDDSEITTVHMSKRFAAPGTPPRIELAITEDREDIVYPVKERML